MDRLSVKFAPSHSSWNYTKLDPRSLGTVEFLCKTAHVHPCSRIPRLQSSPVTFLLFTNPSFFEAKSGSKEEGKAPCGGRQNSEAWPCADLESDTSPSYPPKSRNLCEWPTTAAGMTACEQLACDGWLTVKLKAINEVLTSFCTVVHVFENKSRQDGKGRARCSPLFHVQCFSSKPHGIFPAEISAAAWMIGPGEATRTGSTSPLCGVTRLAEIWRIFAASFHLHFLCKARYDRLMRSAIVIQSGGIMGMIQEDMPKRWRLGIGSREEEWLETIILKDVCFFFLNDIRTSTFPVIPPPQCEWRWLAGNMIGGSSFVGLAEPRPFSGRWEGAWRGYTRKSQKNTCWYCVPKDLLCMNCICMYGWTKTMAETIHRLKSVVCFLFGAVRSSQKMASRLAFSFCAKRCTNWHSKISQCRCSLFHSARLHRRDSQKPKRMPWLSYHPAWNI